ncbi:MAG: beta-ketoacyl-[acyl-carrier-protein] synthase II [Rubrivivax sp.]|nr:beta-ketoacyl-[acyl-carrier-protein] synthase II [Rubrivivax sp.]
MRPIAVRAFSTVSAAGVGQAALLAALRDGRTKLTPNVSTDPPLATHVGRVAALDDEAASRHDAGATLPPQLAERWDARATRLAWLGLNADDFAEHARQAVKRHGATRVGLALGTSASTIGVTEAAYRQLARDGGFPPAMRQARLNTPHALAMFAAEVLGVAGPAVTVSTACSSSAKVFALAERWLRLGLVDAVVVGGVEALGASLLWGFASLGLLSATPCRPFDRRRDGISIGEAAGFALLERGDEGGAGEDAAARLIGHGEASDAFHMSSPHPQGLGADIALGAALARAGMAGDAVDYVNLHGTASAKNDEVEAGLVARRYGPRTLVSATKGLTGHAMGAAGMLEAALCLLALGHGVVPGSTGCEEPEAPDPAFGMRLVLAPRAQQIRIAVSHSFGFGGSNAVLVFAGAA